MQSSVANASDAPRTVKSLDGVGGTRELVRTGHLSGSPLYAHGLDTSPPVPPPLTSTVPVQDGCGRSLRPAFAWSPAPTPRSPTPRSPLRWHAD